MCKPAERSAIRARHLAAAILLILSATPAAAAGETSADLPLWLGYFLQQCLNAAMVSAFYALLAVSYALIYGLTGRIVLSFGDFASFGAYASVVAMIMVFDIARLGLVTALPAVLGAAVVCASALGAASQSLVFRPLFSRNTQAMLVASIGVAIIIQEVLRMVTGGREQWLRPVLNDPFFRQEVHGYVVQVTVMQVLILVSAVILSVGLVAAMRLSAFGRLWRACSENERLAGLCGVNVPAVIAATFVIAAAYAGIAGFTVALYYGGVSFYMGLVLGLKALFAAIIGGFGSVGGALLGGILLGTLETLWSAYFSIAYRDVAVFLLFILVLVLRPSGLLTVPERRDHRL